MKDYDLRYRGGRTVSLGREAAEGRQARPGKTGSPHPTPRDPEIRTALVSSGGMVGAPRREGPFHIALTTSAPPAPLVPLRPSLFHSLSFHPPLQLLFLRVLLSCIFSPQCFSSANVPPAGVLRQPLVLVWFSCVSVPPPGRCSSPPPETR